MNELSKLSDHTHLFQNLVCIDVLLTNKCNLRCSYCFQQHMKDDGYFSQKSMRQVWDWLRDINSIEGKKLQFFGGEPMLHKDFILDFIRLNRDEFEKQAGKMTTSIVSNGLFFDDEFLNEYLGVGTTEVNFSIDTVNPKLCDRGLSQKQIYQILDSVEKSCLIADPGMVAGRINITPENHKGFKELYFELYERGLRRFWFHPLTHSLTGGSIDWTERAWKEWKSDIDEIVDLGLEMEHFTVVEGVGVRNYDEFFGVRDIAMDASGDFTSCYVWISTKEELIGNLFRDELDLEKYLKMKTDYDEMTLNDPQCLSCDRQNLCYQFNSGNKAVYGVNNKADDLCQKVVDIYHDTNVRLQQVKLKKKLSEIWSTYRTEGESSFLRSCVFLLKFYLDRGSLKNTMHDEVVNAPELAVINLELANNPVSLGQILTLFKKVLDKPLHFESIAELITAASREESSETSFRDIYQVLCQQIGLEKSYQENFSEENEDLIFLSMLHYVILGRSEYYHVVAYGGYE